MAITLIQIVSTVTLLVAQVMLVKPYGPLEKEWGLPITLLTIVGIGIIGLAALAAHRD